MDVIGWLRQLNSGLSGTTKLLGVHLKLSPAVRRDKSVRFPILRPNDSDHGRAWRQSPGRVRFPPGQAGLLAGMAAVAPVEMSQKLHKSILTKRVNVTSCAI